MSLVSLYRAYSMNTDIAMLSVVHYIGVKKTVYGLLFVRVIRGRLP